MELEKDYSGRLALVFTILNSGGVLVIDDWTGARVFGGPRPS